MKRKGHHKNKGSPRQVMGLPGLTRPPPRCSVKGLAHLGAPLLHSYPPMGPGCPHQPERGQASALQPSVQGPSCQGGLAGSSPWTATQEPPGGRCLLQQTAHKQQVPMGTRGEGHAPAHASPSESQTGSNGVGRGRTTPDTLKVKNKPCDATGKVQASSLPPAKASILTSLPAYTPRCWPPPLPPAQVLTPILGTTTYSWLYLCHIMS